MKTLFSTQTGRKLVFALFALLGALLMVHFGHAQAGAATGLIVGMSWLTDEPTVKLLQTLGYVGPAGHLSPLKRILAKTADYTVLGTEGCGTVFTTRGAAGAVNFTLPAIASVPAGWHCQFRNLVDQNMTVTAAVADTLITDGDLTADSLAVSTASHKIGATIEVFSDGTAWIANGCNVGATYTVAT